MANNSEPTTWLRDTLAFGPHAGAHRVAIRAGLSLGIPLLVLIAIGRADLGVYATFAAFASLYGRRESHADRLRMQAAAGAMLLVAMAIGTGLAQSGMPATASALVVGLVAGVVTLLAEAARWHPPGALFGVFAVGATAGMPVGAGTWAALALTAVPTLALALVIGSAGGWRAARRTPRPTTAHDGTTVPLAVIARDQRRPVRLTGGMLRDGAVVALATSAAGAATASWSLHWYWAAVGAVAALGGATVAARLTRAVHRVVGTLVGVLLAAALLALQPGPLVTVLAAIALQVGAELFVGRNYALTVICVTPLALLMVHLGSAEPAGELVGERLLATLIGVAIGVLAALGAHALQRMSHRASADG